MIPVPPAGWWSLEGLLDTILGLCCDSIAGCPPFVDCRGMLYILRANVVSRGRKGV